MPVNGYKRVVVATALKYNLLEKAQKGEHDEIIYYKGSSKRVTWRR